MVNIIGHVKMSCYIYCANYHSSNYGPGLSGLRHQMRPQNTVWSNLVSIICPTCLIVADTVVLKSTQLLTLLYHLPISLLTQWNGLLSHIFSISIQSSAILRQYPVRPLRRGSWQRQHRPLHLARVRIELMLVPEIKSESRHWMESHWSWTLERWRESVSN